jgi:hypothetical protein
MVGRSGKTDPCFASYEICETRPIHQEYAHNIRVLQVNATKMAQDMGRRQGFRQKLYLVQGIRRQRAYCTVPRT